jgi:glycosyltransferase involved in cell wall biosynthesis
MLNFVSEREPITPAKEPSKIALVLGLKAAPDYGACFLESLTDFSDSTYDITAIASKESREAQNHGGRVRYVWSKSVFHPLQIWIHLWRNRPHLVHIQHEINLFGGIWGVLMLPVLILLLKSIRLRIVTTIHAVVPLPIVQGDFARFFSFPKHPLVSRIMKSTLYWSYHLTLHLCDRVIVHSPFLSDQLVAYYGGSLKNIRVIPHPELALVSGQTGEPTPKVVDRLSGKRVILSFGYLMRRKGIEDLISAFASVSHLYPDYVLVVAGGSSQPDYVTELKQLVMEKHVKEQVIFTGFIEAADVHCLFERSEFVALSALLSFSASGPYAVALAHEKAVVAPRIGYFAETVAHMTDGLLYDPHDLASFSDALRQMMGSSELRARMSQAIASKRKDYSPALIVKKTCHLYEEVLCEFGV